ncbi:hypothetical protein B7494_g6119 [Chlorociboria aeruginascens]|nr:hypothetical protein B7494_g6119 [Chlorociboria aeruginascens]
MSATRSDMILAKMMESGQFTDLKFVCNGREFKVHKAVVCPQSPVINAAIQGGFEESETNVIIMDSYQPSTVKRLVQFMYVGDYDDPKDDGEALADHNTCGADDDKIEEEDLIGIRFSACEEDGKGSPSKELSAPLLSESTAIASLFEHIRVNSIGDYYGIDELVSLVNSKIKHILWNNDEDRSWITSFPTIIERAVELTGDDELLSILASATAANISDLLELEHFKSLGVMTDFSMKVLQSCARDIQAQAGELEDTKLQMSKADKRFNSEIESQNLRIKIKESQISSLRGCLTVLRKTGACRNCDAYFQCYIDPDECVLRCDKCRYE